MSNLETKQKVHSELSSWEVECIRDTAFRSPTIILDISVDDQSLEQMVQEYETARYALQECAEEIAEYCNITEMA